MRLNNKRNTKKCKEPMDGWYLSLQPVQSLDRGCTANSQGLYGISLCRVPHRKRSKRWWTRRIPNDSSPDAWTARSWSQRRFILIPSGYSLLVRALTYRTRVLPSRIQLLGSHEKKSKICGNQLEFLWWVHSVQAVVNLLGLVIDGICPERSNDSKDQIIDSWY